MVSQWLNHDLDTPTCVRGRVAYLTTRALGRRPREVVEVGRLYFIKHNATDPTALLQLEPEYL